MVAAASGRCTRNKPEDSARTVLVGVGDQVVRNWATWAGAHVGLKVWPHLLRHTFATRLAEDVAALSLWPILPVKAGMTVVQPTTERREPDTRAASRVDQSSLVPERSSASSRSAATRRAA
jgi:integrase